ncbi:MAG: hypothetical protein V4760_01055 [Bdellovibrionota bacterium]
MVVFAPRLLCLILILAFAPLAHAQILFEGYSKVMLGAKHVGFTIQRYEYDAKKKEFLATSFLKTSPDGGNITESTQSRASASLKPIGYKYTNATGDKVKMIDATFKGETMTLVIVENGQRKALPAKKLPKGVFLSNYLAYVMLQGKEGIKVGANYGYQAIAEEDGGLYTGQAFIKGEETYNGVQVYRVLNSFMIGTPAKAEYVSFVTAKGEVVGSRSPAQDLSTEVVSSIQEATAGLSVNNNHLKQLFGSMPSGLENPIARKSGGAPLGAAPDKQKTLEGPDETKESASPKTEGVPGGKGITLKPDAEKAPQEKATTPAKEATPAPAKSATPKAK